MNWKSAQTALAASLPNYESRLEQDRLARTIENTLSSQGHELAQAGTGTGKSLAALIPAIAHSLETGFPVVVSSATKALQDQYAGKDLPFLAEHLGVPFTYSVLKGRSNYVCLDKVNQLKPDAIQFQEALVAELDEHETGDFDGLVTPIDPRTKPLLTTGSDECPGKNNCPFGAVCFAELAKQRAKESNIVVVNHSVLVTDLVVREKTEGRAGMLPNYEAVVIDEAHELEEYATGALGAEFTQRSFTQYASEVANLLGDPKVTVKVNGAAQRLFAALDFFQGSEKSRGLDDAALLEHEDEFVNTLDALRNLREQVVALSVYGNDDLAGRRKRLMKRGESLIDRMVSVVLSSSSDLVRWVERDDKRGTTLKYAPLSVAPFLRANLWEIPNYDLSTVSPDDFEDVAQSEGPRTAVLLSATLALAGDFSYIASRLGVDDYTSFDAGTPFDYPAQAGLYVPKEGYDPSQGFSWQGKVSASIGELVAAAGGRALLLFTSRVAMEQVYAQTADRMLAAGLTVLKQGDKPNRQLAATFKDDETSVLFALKSFMTGIDIQGDSLRLVVIDKLPFPVPTDVIVKARADAIDATAKNTWVDGSFPTMTVPMMALTLMQAFGRLIRTKDDEGLVAILDSRLHTKKYGRKILTTLPPAQQLGALHDATDYLQDLTKRRG